MLFKRFKHLNSIVLKGMLWPLCFVVDMQVFLNSNGVLNKNYKSCKNYSHCEAKIIFNKFRI